jgi:hypothetical protein
MDGALAYLGRCEAQLRFRIAELLDALHVAHGHHELGFSSIDAYVMERCRRLSPMTRVCQDRPVEWCPRCGGPIEDAVCENCISAAERRQQEKEKLSLQRAKVWRWVERFTEVPREQDPMSALLSALLAGAVELHVLFGPEYRIVVRSEEERVVSLPAHVVRDLEVLLYSSMQATKDADVIEAHLVMNEHGCGVRLRTELFQVERIPGGYSVRLR